MAACSVVYIVIFFYFFCFVLELNNCGYDAVKQISFLNFHVHVFRWKWKDAFVLICPYHVLFSIKGISVTNLYRFAQVEDVCVSDSRFPPLVFK